VCGGERWSIGSSASISILNEPWLPNRECITSDIPVAHFVQNFTINSLMNLSQRLTIVLWSIWKHRKLRVWDDVMETSATVVERARNMVVDWLLANTPVVLASTVTAS